MNLNLIFIVIVIQTCEVYSESKTVLSVPRSLAFQVLQSTIKSKKNTIVSVLPLQFSLCKLASIATGEAKVELMKAVGMTSDKMVNSFYSKFRETLEHQSRLDLTYANKMYVNYTDDIDPNFIANSSKMYGVSVEKVSFNFPKTASAFINKKISASTYRRIEDLVQPSDFNKLTRMLLVSVAHYKATWETPFKTSLTKATTFRHLDNKISKIPMMTRLQSLHFYDARDFQAVGIKTIGMFMLFVKPTFVDLERLLHKFRLDPDLLNNAINQMRPTEMKLVIPRMKIKSEHYLTGYLKEIGITEILNHNSTGLNGILKQRVNSSNIFINKIIQKLALEVDEYGIYRIRYARWDDEKEHWPPILEEVVLDRPFYFSVNLGVAVQGNIGKENEAPPTQIENYELMSGVFYGPE